jgi:signal transduction histidine kinase/DNA-binding response OmpR family regulator
VSSSRHPLLERQLKRLGLTVESLPAPVASLLDLFDRTYRTADQDRNLLERSLTISSQEMQSLYEALRAASESRVSEMEKAVSEARASAEAASRAKSEFLANISHEIRTPLNAVIGRTSVLLGSDLSSEHRDHVQTIRKSGEALLGLINEILDFSRLEAGRMPLEEHPFLLRERIAIAFELVAQEARRKGLRLSWEVDPGCPDVLIGDAARLQQILLNLLYNAVKFTPAGEVTLRAGLLAGSGETREDIGDNPEDAVLRFQVSDTGVGLPPGRIEELFGPFLQADASTSRRYGGSGLGLAISRRLVERMGGEITAQGEPGLGSIFTFTVRFRRGTEAELASEALLSEEPVVQPLLQPAGTEPLRILLAEDNPLNQKVAQLLLEKLGYSADLAANGHEVLAALERQDYDVVLMDVMMPELDGLEATRRIVARWPPEARPRIVALTASAMREDRERCLAAGMDEYLSKPIDLPALAEALRRAAQQEAELPPLPMIDELWRLDPQETVRLVESFLVHLDLELGALREAVQQEDGGRIERVAHSLRGACATLGLPRLPDSLGELIHLIHRGEGQRAPAALVAVDQDAVREREVLRKVLARRG